MRSYFSCENSLFIWIISILLFTSMGHSFRLEHAHTFKQPSTLTSIQIVYIWMNKYEHRRHIHFQHVSDKREYWHFFLQISWHESERIQSKILRVNNQEPRIKRMQWMVLTHTKIKNDWNNKWQIISWCIVAIQNNNVEQTKKHFIERKHHPCIIFF